MADKFKQQFKDELGKNPKLAGVGEVGDIKVADAKATSRVVYVKNKKPKKEEKEDEDFDWALLVVLPVVAGVIVLGSAAAVVWNINAKKKRGDAVEDISLPPKASSCSVASSI